MSSEDRRFDIIIVGAGILGVTLAFWITKLYDCSVCLLDRESQVAFHTTSRNTGVVHRPFYLNPEKKRVFARSAQKSYPLWRDLTQRYGLTWKQVGTLEVATNDSDISTLELYKKWSIQNGMNEYEVELLDSGQVNALEHQVACAGAIHSKTDTAVNYSELTGLIFELASKGGVEFLGGKELRNLKETSTGTELEIQERNTGSWTKISASLLINAAGGGSLDIAHMCNLAREYTDLHFRGEYWVVGDPLASKISRNIYSVARYKEFPFLDPHFIVRASGRREIGPNAVLVSGPFAYSGLSSGKFELVKKMFERPNMPKVKLFTSLKFLSLAWNEWKSSLSKQAMCGRVRQFIPSLEASMLNKRGLAGVRSSLIGNDGFVPEALQVEGAHSIHILNYNSPGATGAPAFSAYVVSRMQESGWFDGISLKREMKPDSPWNFEQARDFERL